MTSPRREIVPPPPVEEFVSKSGLVLLELWTRWSGEAFLVGATIDRLLRAHPDLRISVGRIDAHAHAEFSARYHADAPTLLLFQNGAVIGRHRGLVTLDGLSAWLDRAVAGAASPEPQPTLQDEEQR